MTLNQIKTLLTGTKSFLSKIFSDKDYPILAVDHGSTYVFEQEFV
jgi:hypothetical protein